MSCVGLSDSVNTQLWNGEQLPKDACLIYARSILQVFSICLHGALKRSVVVQGCVWNHSCIIICILPVHQLCNYLIWPARSDHEILTPFNEHHHSWEAMRCCNWMKLINPMPANTTNSVRPSGRGCATLGVQNIAEKWICLLHLPSDLKLWLRLFVVYCIQFYFYVKWWRWFKLMFFMII